MKENSATSHVKAKPGADLLIGLIAIYALLLIGLSSLPFSALWPPSPWLRVIGFTVVAVPLSGFVLCLRRAVLGVDFGKAPTHWLIGGVLAIGIETIATYGFDKSPNIGFLGTALFFAGMGAIVGTKIRRQRTRNTARTPCE